MKKKKKENLNQTEQDVASKEKSKKMPRFGLLDAVIVIVVIAIIAGVAFRYNLFSVFNGLKNLKECVVTFSVTDIESTTPQLFINSGDAVYFKNTGKEFGTIMDSSEVSNIPLIISPASKTFIKDGKAITVNYPPNTRVDAQGRIKCEGEFLADGTFLLNGTDFISAGQTYVICTEKVTLEITILNTELIEEWFL